ncbi:MAG: hypothetical protein GFH27_549279n353 [Chloroflexi bacterium AL-W]|nr:hypothetical protein [Chloroflexi bacterium AL-N1]NOK65319.1 hypothetical protein [Chloroflexi bacterium AL-N10]NOK72416.1 hypothetical protein [Chloroflexi bacterium AL-N5]NOK79498.1 hypothetical protein [Chloroflexi bacterium AL-W]NOK87414.1 hypothetical protein [Chloroflexi bacterium AL-N15]
MVVTFNQHIAPHRVYSILDEYQVDVNTLRVEYSGKDEYGREEIWTGFIRNHHGTDFALLDRAAEEQMDVDFFKPHGVVSLQGSAPVDQVERLNQHEHVFLADPVATYIDTVASQDRDVQLALSEVLEKRTQRLEQNSEPDEYSLSINRNTKLALDNFVDKNSELIPHVEVRVRDVWNLIDK